MKVYYHNDLDGRCAAAIAYRKILENELGARAAENNIQFIEIDYKDEFDPNTISKDERVIILDFSFPPDLMARIFERTTKVVWIDHHKTAEAYRYDRGMAGLRDFSTPGRSGTQLAWAYFYPRLPEPLVVTYVGLWDTWRWDPEHPEVEQFVEGVKLLDHSPMSQEWPLLFDDPRALRQTVENGMIAVRYREQVCADYLRSFGFEFEFEGLKGLACGIYFWGSRLFGSRGKEYDLLVPFEYNGHRWSIGLYTLHKDLDVGGLARKLGGGGHQQAAGFVADRLPEWLKR